MILGRARLLKADPVAQPLLNALRMALGIHSYRDEISDTFYIGSSIMGKRLLLQTGQHKRVDSLLKERWERSGGIVVTEGISDLVLRLSLERRLPPGVSASYRWLSRTEARRLAEVLSAAVAKECGLTDLGARVSLESGWPPGIPYVEVQVGHDEGVEATLLNQVSEGLYRGLVQFCSDTNPSVVEEPRGEVAGVSAASVGEVSERGEIFTEPLPDDEPDPEDRIVLFPDPTVRLRLSPAASPNPEPKLKPEPEAEFAFVTAVPPPAVLVSIVAAEARPVTMDLSPESTPSPGPNLTPESDLTPAPAPMAVVPARTIELPPSIPGVPLKPFLDPRSLHALGPVVVFQRERPAPAPARVLSPAPPADPVELPQPVNAIAIKPARAPAPKRLPLVIQHHGAVIRIST